MALALHIPEAEKTEAMACQQFNQSVNQCFRTACYWLHIWQGAVENREERKDIVFILKDLIIYQKIEDRYT